MHTKIEANQPHAEHKILLERVMALIILICASCTNQRLSELILLLFLRFSMKIGKQDINN